MIAWLRAVAARIASTGRRPALDRDLDEELDGHIEMATSKRMARGMSRDDARREALAEFGGIQQVREQYQDRRGLPLLDRWGRNVRFGLRNLRRQPGASTLVIVCLTIGVGANAAVVSWIEGILFRPYPLVQHQDRLIALSGTTRGEPGATELSWPDLLDLQRRTTLLESVFVSKITGTTLSVGERAQAATGSIVSANYFDAIGVRPVLGRGFERGEDAGRRAHPIVVISYDLWQERFKGDPGIIGKPQRLAGEIHTIVGVAPQGFYGTFVGWTMSFWVPASQEELFEAGGYKLEDRSARWAEAYAFLKPGVARNQAQAEVSTIARGLEASFPQSNRGRGMQAWSLWETPFNNAGTLLPTLEIMVAVTIFVLVIACANVANLLLVRSVTRAREMTLRLAIGASHGHLIAQLFTEGLLLSIAGGTGGLIVAYLSRHALVQLLPLRSGVSMYLPGELDARVLLANGAVGLMVTMLACLAPCLQVRKVDLAGALKSASATVVGGRSQAWMRASLIVVQVAASFVLVVCGGLLLQSLDRIRRINPGFATGNVLNTSVPLAAAGYDVPNAKVFEDALVDRIVAMPGVESAVFARVTPLGYGTYSMATLAVVGYTPAPDEPMTVRFNQVGPTYFQTLGIAVTSGREFARTDDEAAPLVAVINDTMARRYWRQTSPIGERFQTNGLTVTVVGVAVDTKYESLREAAIPFFYVPMKQAFAMTSSLSIRTSQPAAAVAPMLAREVRSLDANLAPFEVITLRDQVNRSISPQLVAVTLVGVLGGVALLLASVGLYGVMSYLVSQTTRELRVRIVLGAARSSVFRLVMVRGLRLALGGMIVGALTASATTSLLGNMLYQVNPHDPAVFGAAVGVLLVFTVAACLVPGWRAARTTALQSLREE